MISIPDIGMLSVSTKTYQFLDEYHTTFNSKYFLFYMIMAYK